MARLKIFLIILASVSTFVARAQERYYLTGKGPDDAVIWDFKCSTGRNSGYWTTIPVPSNWETQGFGNYTYWSDPENYKTNPEIGYYRTTFQLENTSEKFFKLVFQGSMTDTQVKINGRSVGAVHEGGYTQFSYDISNLVKAGENLIEVSVSKPSGNPAVQQAERFADYWIFGGIFRPVYIDILPQSHLDRIAIDATMDGRLKLDAFIINPQRGQKIVAQVTTLNNEPLGKPFEYNIKGETGVVRLEQDFKAIKLWSHEFPNLYKIHLNLMSDNQLLHTIQERFGFRTFEVRDYDGFYLNGKRILLKGASMHSFRPETGRSLSPADNLADVKLMKDLNFNTVRTPCYPPDEHFLALCDSLGLLVLDELPGWSEPLETNIGNKLVKELVVRDVNHPSVIMWGNGNHRAHNPELEDAFLQWDIQRRRPYKNAAKTESWPGENPGRFELIQTQYYPTYKELTERLSGDQIVLPNEVLHGLYDGGAGASLSDYWQAIQESELGGGLIIWALYDEGLMRSDRGYTVDNQINKAPDGIVGPHQEKKGSYYTIKEIWSPVQIGKNKDETGIKDLQVENHYAFTNLNSCTFSWKYIHFASPLASTSGYSILKEGSFKGPDVLPGKSGKLQIPVYSDLRGADAVEIEVSDPHQQSLWKWRFKLKNDRHYFSAFLPKQKGQPVQQIEGDSLGFQSGNVTIRFDTDNAGPKSVIKDTVVMPLVMFPKVVAEYQKGLYTASEDQPLSYSIKKQEDSFTVVYEHIPGFDNLKWTIMPNGILKLDYSYTLPQGLYYYAGVGFELDGSQVRSKRWLGAGPYRIYKNRNKGTTLNVWNIKNRINIPGEVYEFPEFEGYFGDWYWAQLNLLNDQTLGMMAENLYLGLLKPNAGEDPKNAAIHYPEQSGVYFFNCISPIGEKWKKPEEIGPSAQLNYLEGSQSGTVYFNFYDNSVDNANSNNIEIE